MMQNRYWGIDNFSQLTAILAGKSRIFLVTGKNSYQASGSETILAPFLKNRQVYRFSKFTANPQIKDIKKGLDALRRFHPDAVIAIGGGSAIDMAKLLVAFQNSTCELIEAIEKNTILSDKFLPLIAIPTTAGSGSESTHFAVIYHEKQKFSLSHEKLLPSHVFLIPEFLGSLSSREMAISGADALCQAIESYWSIHSTTTSLILAENALISMMLALKHALHQREKSSFQMLMLGANLAGQAINITKTTAPHALSYTLTSHFGIPHGQAVALLLPAFVAFNTEVTSEDCNDLRGSDFVKIKILQLVHFFGCSSSSEMTSTLQDFFRQCGLATRLTEVGITSETEMHTIAQNGNFQRMQNNPRKISYSQILDLLNGIY